jgi:uncharacterized peroxidase-related enzyme
LTPWIEWVPEEEATGRLDELYRQHSGRFGVDHILKIHSLNPESLEGHYRYYDHLMRGPSGLSRGEREMIAVVVSALNECVY